jgi:MFS family permease
MSLPPLNPSAGFNSRVFFNMPVIVASLGYFVDIYDLILFGVVKDPSLTALGYGNNLLTQGTHLLNMQMIGMLIGGIIWGIIGDKRGRVSVLFGSIFLYSAANIANGFVQDMETYALLRFLAGVGLAGELGAGITLVSESLATRLRGYGTMLVVVVGALGAVLAALVADFFQWRTAYFVGGGLGILLLILRISTYESGMFNYIRQNKAVKKGHFFSLFTSRKRFFTYLNCILIGLPVWFVIGVLVINSKDFSNVIGINDGIVITGKSIMFSYLGLSFGDILSGLLSQWLKSRRKVVIIYLFMNVICVLTFLFIRDIHLSSFYLLCFILGAATGFWAIFVTIAAEQFGTNLRATVTTTVPNFVRGSLVLINLSFVALKNHFLAIVPDGLDLLYAAIIVGMACILLSLVAVLSIRETFHKDLNYIEETS